MLILKLALRSLGRRKGRMVLIGSLVALGSFLIVFGTIFAASAQEASKASIIDNFTGDFIVYSGRSKDLPSPFAFNTPLPRIRDAAAVESFLSSLPEVEAIAPFAQNFGLIQVERGGKKLDLPFIFYAVEPTSYRRVFSQVSSPGGSFFGLTDSADAAQTLPGKGVMISEYQNEQYFKNYGVNLSAGEPVTLLGITEGGANTETSRLIGTFVPGHFTSVFNYINFMDADTYSRLYNYSGVEALPASFDAGLSAASGDESAIFGLATDPGLATLDLSKLKSEALSGATMIAVRLRDHSRAAAIMEKIASLPELAVKTARWDLASGFYAQVAASLKTFIFLATGLVFLVVALIFTNTLIISVTERTAEIGTMRAIGSEKSFISMLFIAEALVLNLCAALVGMAGAGILVAALGKGGLRLPELVSQFLIGGGALELKASIGPFLLSFAIVGLVSILATIYPVRVATSISPLTAMNER